MGEEPRRHEAIDLYELLEVSPRASQDVIQAAYRALARNCHPDVSAGSDEGPTFDSGQRMRQLNVAYGVLSHAERRARYDLECARARRQQRAAQMDHPVVRPLATEPGRVHLLPVAARARRIDDHFPALNGGAILVLMTVAMLTALLLVLVFASLEPTHDEGPPFDRPLVQLTGR